MKKLVRSTNEKKIFGVCGGLGAYFNCDPLLFRCLFILLLLVGGSGVLIYLCMALILPNGETEIPEKGHIERSVSDKKVFGVCGGLAAYFGMDVTVLRLIFLLAILFAGCGLLGYLILAIAIPKAKV